MKITWVEPAILAASSIPIDIKDLRSLREQGVGAIISLTEQPLTAFKSIRPDFFSMLDITYLHVPVPDHHPPTLEQAHVILRFIDLMRERQRAVFVHCHAGVGRTGTILHLYYLAQDMTLEAAREQVRRKRPQSTLLSDKQKAFLSEYARVRRASLSGSG
jgi:atypical dual specificity phosphatase